ncbi:MAG: MATE family efflux transporter [Gemmatimonadetes bacterium]|nr:MATE family efflux transporter [Gemmatimonadota bacterium]MBT6144581.1 MATE family efflux transporter [Gemmatimonadota bacterium]MBT7860590.1 MATE family efflux transporter [Gemmatimonadota bacterium]
MSTSLNGRILRLAIPSLLASISVPLIGIADTAMIGHLEDVAFLGAVATASVVFDILLWGAGFLRMGTTSIVAQYHGAGDRSACKASLYRGLLIALVLAAVMIVLRGPVAEIGFSLAGGSSSVQTWAHRYFEVRILGVPFVLAIYVLNGFFLGTANAMAPLAITIVTNVINVGVDYALIFGHWGAPALGVVGAAWAAVAANAAGILVAIGLLLWRYQHILRAPLQESLFQTDRLRHLFDTNINLFLRTLCLLYTQFAMLAMASRMGEVALAAHAVVTQVWSLVSYGIDGFAHAGETLIGNTLGTGEVAGTRDLARRILWWGAGIGLVFTVVYATSLEQIAALFTEHEQVVVAVAGLSLLVAFMQPLNALVFVFDGILIGANDVAYLFRAMAISAIVFFTPAALLLVVWSDGGLLSAWMAYAMMMLGRLMTLTWRYRGDAWLRSFVTAPSLPVPVPATGD